MQKLCTVLTILLLSVGVSQGQDVEVGFWGGTNYSDFKGDTGAVDQRDTSGPLINQGSTSAEFSRVFGGRAGGFLRFDVSKSFSVRTEVTYSQKGGALDLIGEQTMSETLVRVTSALKFRYDYLDVPLLAEYSFETGSRFRPQVFVGPTIGFALGSNLDSEVTTRFFNQFGQEKDLNVIVKREFEKPDIETVDVGAIIGGGVSYLFSSEDSIFLDVRYNPSFTAFNSGSIADAGQNVELENEAITVGVGYSFSL
jgi:hypothetical protein